jgi:hypothetical protein
MYSAPAGVETSFRERVVTKAKQNLADTECKPGNKCFIQNASLDHDPFLSAMEQHDLQIE